MVNEHFVDYQPNPSELTSSIHPLIFLWTPKEFISPERFLNFFLKSVYPTMVAEMFQIYDVEITATYIYESKRTPNKILPQVLNRFPGSLRFSYN